MKITESMADLCLDTLKPAAKEIGKTLELLPRTINAALEPLQRWVLEREDKLNTAKILLAQKFKNVSIDKITSPESYIAVPALQAISYAASSKELQDMYTNLLANAMNIDTKDNVHPSFVEIIKQLSPNDAQILKIIAMEKIRPLISLYIVSSKRNGATKLVKENCSWIRDYSIDKCCLSFNNLSRLGLIEITDRAYSHSEAYGLVEQNPRFIALKDSIQLAQDEKIKFDNGYIKLNEFTEVFCNICIGI